MAGGGWRGTRSERLEERMTGKEREGNKRKGSGLER